MLVGVAVVAVMVVAMVAVVVGHISVYLIKPLGESPLWVETATALFTFQ